MTMTCNSKTLAVLFVEYLKDAVVECNHSFPVSIKWVVRTEEERQALRAKPRVKPVAWAVLSGTGRCEADVHRWAVQQMAMVWARRFACPEGIVMDFDVDASWFEVVDAPHDETVTLRVIQRKDL
jgi:hypothetical protein